MRILVIGGTGHTGERVVRLLIRMGHEVRVLSRRGPEEPIAAGLVRAGAVLRRGQCDRRWTIWDAIRGCDEVVSCAHIRHAEAIVQACLHRRVPRYIQMSSTRGLTRFVNHAGAREVILGERAITTSLLEYTIIRPTMIFGGRRDANMTRLFDWFERRNWFPIVGDGHNMVQPVYVEDVVNAMAAAVLNADATVRETFDIAGPQPMEYRDFILQTAHAIGREDVRLLHLPRQQLVRALSLVDRLHPRLRAAREYAERMGEERVVTIERARARLDYDPIPFADAIRQKAAGKAEVEFIYGE